MSYMYDATSLGQFGNEVIGNGQSATGNFAAIQALSTTSLSSVVDQASGEMNLLAGVSLPAGTILYGRFTTVGVTTGLVVAYKNGIK
jgi:hypothetical protein